MAYKSGKISLNFFQISWSQFKKGHYIILIYPCHSYLDALNTTNLTSLRERHTQHCCKYIQKMTQKDNPINFLKTNVTTGKCQILVEHDSWNLLIFKLAREWCNICV